ncbi:MAG: thioesterase [Streptomycetaceae bacterium]|nr:thioesterase [Streptomycetaceae bacterium]
MTDASRTTTSTADTSSAGTAGTAGDWIRCFHPSPEALVRLVCFPHAGGAASFYFPLSANLHPHVEVLAVQYPGRQDRRLEAPVTDIRELAGQVRRALAACADDRPYAFFGHSMGAVVAYETALAADAENAGPVRLFASGRRGPATERHEAAHRLLDDGFIREIRSLDGTDATLFSDEELVRMILPALRADYRAIELYRGVRDARVTCPITVLIGDNDPKATVDEAAAWSSHTTADFDMQVYPGGHFYLVPNRTTVLERIRTTLIHDLRRPDADPPTAAPL